jgi:RHS repeat-associated protein
VAELEFGRAAINRGDGEGWTRSNPVGNEAAFAYGPLHRCWSRCLIDVDQERIREVHEKLEFAAGSGGSCADGVSPTTNPLGYAEEEQDGSGLYNLRAREYDPMLGQMLTMDPIDHSQGASAYQYANDDPMALVDPTGMCASRSSIWDEAFCQGKNAGSSAWGWTQTHVHFTVGVCTQGMVGGFLAGSLNECFGVSTSGQVGFYGSGGAFGTWNPAHIGGMGMLQISNAATIDDLSGKFGDVGGSGALVAQVGGDAFGGKGARTVK